MGSKLAVQRKAITQPENDEDPIDKPFYNKFGKTGASMSGSDKALSSGISAAKGKNDSAAKAKAASKAKGHAMKALAFADSDIGMAKRHMKRAAFHSGVAAGVISFADDTSLNPDQISIAQQFGRAPEDYASDAEPADAELDAALAAPEEKPASIISPEVDDIIARLKTATEGDLDSSAKKEIEGLLERLETLVPELKAAVDNAKSKLEEINPPAEVEAEAEAPVVG